MHYYQFHIGDYKSHAHHLSLLEDLAYRRLLDHYYLHELPIKQRDIARQIGMKDQEQEVLTVLEEFFVSTEDGYINPRADKEIAQYRAFGEAGKLGAAKRWAKPANSPPIQGDNSPPNATPIATINHKPSTNKPKDIQAPDGVSAQVWGDFLKNRKVKLTQTALDAIIREAAKAGWSLEDALRECCARGWRGFKAEWVKPDERKSQPQPKSFAQQEREAGWARWEEQTNRVHPDRIKAQQQSGQIIDMTTKPLEILE